MKIKGRILGCLSMIIASTLNAWAQDSQSQTSLGTMPLTLEKAIEIALAENPTIKVADKDIELKKIAKTEAWQSLLPSVSLDLSLSHSIKVASIKLGEQEIKMGTDGTTTGTGSLGLSLPLFAPAVYQNIKLTKEDILLAQEKSRSSKLDLIQQVTKAYYAVLLSQDSYQVMQKSYQVSKENYEVVENKYKVGKVSEYDKISAEVQMRSMSSTLVSTQTGLNLAKLQLKVLMGITTAIDITIDDSLQAYENSLVLPSVDAEEAELRNNSSLRQLDMNRTLLERTRKLLKTNFMPTVALSLSGTYTSLANKDWNVFHYKYSPSATLAFAISVPIYKASNWTKLKTNRVQLEQLSETRTNAERQLSMAVESYKQNMASTIAQVSSNAEAVKQAEKAVQISSKRYEVGHGTILELNQSETAETQARLTYVQSIYNYLTNKADLDYTLGRETYLK